MHLLVLLATSSMTCLALATTEAHPSDSQLISVASDITPKEKKHLKFAGIPIDGSLKDFGAQMTEKKFVLLYEDDDLLIFDGKKAGMKGCLVYAYAHPTSRQTYMVGINIGAEDKWDKLKYNYLRLKAKMTDMFGEPILCTEVFHTTESPRGQQEAMECVRQGKAEFVSGFKTSTGLISVQIVHSPKVNPETASVVLFYTDLINCIDQVAE